MQKIIFKVIGGVVIFSSLVVFTIAGILLQHTRSFLRDAVRADARVVRIIERRDVGSDASYYPVFSFRDPTGEEHEVYSSSGSFPPANAVGDSVTVLYRPQQPSKAREDSFSELWLLPVILAVVGLFDLTIGLAFIFGPMLFQRLRHETPSHQVA